MNALACLYFFPDFLIPCCPAFKGPFPFAFSAIALLAFASATWLVVGSDQLLLPNYVAGEGFNTIPAFTFSRKAMSSSSNSFFSFFGAFKGLTFPPICDVQQLLHGLTGTRAGRTFSAVTAHNVWIWDRGKGDYSMFMC